MGRLKTGEQLPTQRELSRKLRIAVTPSPAPTPNWHRRGLIEEHRRTWTALSGANSGAGAGGREQGAA